MTLDNIQEEAERLLKIHESAQAGNRELVFKLRSQQYRLNQRRLKNAARRWRLLYNSNQGPARRVVVDGVVTYEPWTS